MLKLCPLIRWRSLNDFGLPVIWPAFTLWVMRVFWLWKLSNSISFCIASTFRWIISFWYSIIHRFLMQYIKGISVLWCWLITRSVCWVSGKKKNSIIKERKVSSRTNPTQNKNKLRQYWYQVHHAQQQKNINSQNPAALCLPCQNNLSCHRAANPSSAYNTTHTVAHYHLFNYWQHRNSNNSGCWPTSHRFTSTASRVKWRKPRKSLLLKLLACSNCTCLWTGTDMRLNRKSSTWNLSTWCPSVSTLI